MNLLIVFTLIGVWEQRKLNEVSDIYDGTHQTPKYQDDGVMFLSVENIKTLTSNKFISREAFEDEFKIRPQRGDVLMTRIGDIGTANVVETDEDLAYYVSLALFKSEELNPYFLQASIYAPFVQDQIWKRTLHIAFPKKINKNEIGQVPINVPTLAEQTKIGSFFKQLDNTITLHQRKLEQLKELKKAYLQLMFPKKDETVPRVRFADFEDDWQLCKLGDVVEIFDGTHQTPRYTDSGVKFVSVENIATLETKKYITHEAYEKEYSKKRAKKGDILMTRIGDIGTMKVIETDEPLAYYVTLALLKAKETNPYFLSFIISSPEIQRNIWKRTLHIAFPKKINLGEINQVEMKITIFEEQDKIGDLFTNLDDAIILNQNKLNQLKSLKKSYLQNMFI